MTYDLVWAERVKCEYKELSMKIARLEVFLYETHGEVYPAIDKQDILLLKAQLDAMRSYAGILLARLHYHNIEIH